MPGEQEQTNSQTDQQAQNQEQNLETGSPSSTILTEKPTETDEEKAAREEREAAETPEEKAAREAQEAETPEEKAAREAREAETPEEKAAREAEEARAALFGAPAEGEEYAIEGLPEGMSIDTDALAAITPIARELNLSSQGLSKIAGVYATAVLPGVTEKVTGALQQDISAQHAAWATEATTLVEGGKDADGNDVAPDKLFDGKKIGEVRQVSAKALDRFGGPEFREFLETTGLGNHPAMLKMAYQVGKAIAEDNTFERGGPPSSAPKSRTEKYYPST